jgi:hypothetical protein
MATADECANDSGQVPYPRSRMGDEVRLSAAELLVNVDPRAAAPDCLAIARYGAVGDEVRRSATEQLAALDPALEPEDHEAAL